MYVPAVASLLLFTIAIYPIPIHGSNLLHDSLTPSDVHVSLDDCVLQEDKCQCALTTPSGTCLRSQGDGTCLLGLCQEGYRCDCFGFEVCSLSTCGKLVPIGSILPSEVNPFACENNPGAGACVVVMDFLDSVAAAVNAEAAAVVSTDEATEDEGKIVTMLAEVVEERKAINQILKNVETLQKSQTSAPDAICEEQEIVMENCTQAVEDSVQKIAVLTSKAVKEVRRASNAMRKARKHRRIATCNDRESQIKEMKLRKAESEDYDSSKKRQRKLRSQKDALDEARRKAAREVGLNARRSRESREKVGKYRVVITLLRDQARKAAEVCLDYRNEKVQKKKAVSPVTNVTGVHRLLI